MSDSVEMSTVPDCSKEICYLFEETDLASSAPSPMQETAMASCAPNETFETRTNDERREGQEPEGVVVPGTAPCRKTPTEVGTSIQVNEYHQNEGRISTRVQRDIVSFASILLVVIFSMVVYIVLRLLKQV